jgi:uncharacterized RDD family membrane protein YckC
VPAQKVDTLQTIELAEGVQIMLRPAGPVRRGFAWLLDMVFLGLIMMVLSIVVGLIGAAVGDEGAEGFFLLLFFFLFWGYFIFFEVLRRGQTPGKKMLGLRVVTTSGARVGVGASILRNLVRFADMMPVGFWLFGMASCVSTRRFQRLGDLVADTVVIYDLPDARVDPHLKNPVVPKAPPFVLTREEQQAFMQFIERAPLWTDSRKEEMVAPLAEILGASGWEGVQRALAIGAWLRDS